MKRASVMKAQDLKPPQPGHRSVASRCGWKSFAAALAALGLPVLPAIPAPSDPGRTLTLSYDFARPVTELNEGRARVAIPGCDSLDRAGKPSLPFRTARMLLPPGFKVARMEVRPSQPPVVMAGTWKPDSGPLAAGEQPGTRAAAGKTGAISSANRPLQERQLAAVHRMSGCDIALINLYPVEPRATNGQLHFSPRLEVTLDLVPAGAKSAAGFAARGQAAGRARVAAWVDNPELLSEYEQAQAAAGPDVPATLDYLLVTRSALVSSFQPLVEQKTRAGLSVKVETMEAITTSQPGRDLPEKLRNYIRHAHTNWGVQYVLLAGDISAVPCRYAYVSRKLAERDCLVPSDLYYACLDGTWNRDGDGRWGETTDGEEGGDVDLLAEVDVGRAPVDTPAEAANFVEKTVRYEKQGARNAAEVLLLATYLEQGSAQGGTMFDRSLPRLAGFTPRWLDDRPQTAARWNPADALRELNRGPQLVLYNGHGDSDTVMRLSRSDLDALTNQEPFLFQSVGCNAGQFDNDEFTPDCIGEELIKRNRSGAFAAILNSRLGWYAAKQEWTYSGEFQIKLIDELTGPGKHRLGAACQLAKQGMLGQVEASGWMTYRWCYYGITLFGDPHLSFELPHAKPRREGEA